MQKKESVLPNCLHNNSAKYSSSFCTVVSMQTLICLSNNVHFPGIFHAKKKQSVPPNCLLLNLANYSSNFCTNVSMQTLISLSNYMHFPVILQAKESQVLLIIACF